MTSAPASDSIFIIWRARIASSYTTKTLAPSKGLALTLMGRGLSNWIVLAKFRAQKKVYPGFGYPTSSLRSISLQPKLPFPLPPVAPPDGGRQVPRYCQVGER